MVARGKNFPGRQGRDPMIAALKLLQDKDFFSVAATIRRARSRSMNVRSARRRRAIDGKKFYRDVGE
jgi:hypothetical protein